MAKTLLVSGHTDLEHSVANKAIIAKLKELMPAMTVVDLGAEYPDFKIDVQKEQQRLLDADVIILQFPIFWYSAPSILHRWMEETFIHGFSHGRTGDKLKGKKIFVSVTSGAPEAMYARDGAVGYTIEDFLAPIKASCQLCGMTFEGFVYTGGVSYSVRSSDEQIETQKTMATEHAQKVFEKIKDL